MKSLSQIIKESFNSTDINEFDSYIVEGLNIDPISKTVSLTDTHNNGVDFSLLNNPVYSKYKEYDVISIFKRTKLYDIDNQQRDGNPFIYALKNKYGWKFNITNEEIYKYIKRFLTICKKINSQYDTIIVTPSTSDINEKFMKVISNQIKSKDILNEFFVKLSIEEIIDDDLIDKEQIQNDYPNEFNKVIAEIHRSFRRMKGTSFEAKIMNKKYLKYIKYISTEYNEDIRSKIDNKCINGVLSNFVPKSITIITLLSKL